MFSKFYQKYRFNFLLKLTSTFLKILRKICSKVFNDFEFANFLIRFFLIIFFSTLNQACTKRFSLFSKIFIMLSSDFFIFFSKFQTFPKLSQKYSAESLQYFYAFPMGLQVHFIFCRPPLLQNFSLPTPLQRGRREPNKKGNKVAENDVSTFQAVNTV